MIVVWTGVMAKEGERFFRWNWQDFLLNKKLVVKKKKKSNPELHHCFFTLPFSSEYLKTLYEVNK